MKYEEAIKTAGKAIAALESHCRDIRIAGSVRRKCPNPKDVELVLIRNNSALIQFKDVINSWTKVKGNWDGAYTQRKLNGYTLDIFMVEPRNFGLQLAIRTGPARYSKDLAKRWVTLGYKSINGYLWKVENGQPIGNRLSFPDEESLFQFLGVKLIAPEFRGKSCIELVG